MNAGNAPALPGAGGVRAGPGVGARWMARGSAALPAHARAGDSPAAEEVF